MIPQKTTIVLEALKQNGIQMNAQQLNSSLSNLIVKTQSFVSSYEAKVGFIDVLKTLENGGTKSKEIRKIFLETLKGDPNELHKIQGFDPEKMSSNIINILKGSTDIKDQNLLSSITSIYNTQIKNQYASFLRTYKRD